MSGYINPGFSQELKESKELVQSKVPATPGDNSAGTQSTLITRTPRPHNGTLSNDSTEIEMSNNDRTLGSGASDYQRRASVADIAIAFATSSMKPSSSMEQLSRGKLSLGYWKRSYKFIHPFGHTTNIVDEIMGSGYIEDGERTSSSSPAKLIVWIIFGCFLVGMAGAIILGAETKKTSESIDSTYVNVSDIISG